MRKSVGEITRFHHQINCKMWKKRHERLLTLRTERDLKDLTTNESENPVWILIQTKWREGEKERERE